MSGEQCYKFVCFIRLDGTEQKLFGFSEYLAGLALLVLAWTIADTRYRFRVRTAPLPLQGITFAVVVIVGILTLLTDLWRAERWFVPKGDLLTPASWQALLAFAFLITFLTWAWFAFIRPPKFGRSNAERYARALYRAVLTGSPADLAVVADELTGSASSLIRNASFEAARRDYREHPEKVLLIPKAEAYANEILLLIADKRLCRVIVESSSITALALFQAMNDLKKFDIQIGTFARNIVNEAINNRNSFLFHEGEGYESGLLGYHKPLSQAMFANFRMVETIGTMLDTDYVQSATWNADQWQVYCRVTLITFQAYVAEALGQHSFALTRAMHSIQMIGNDVYKLNEATNVSWDNDALRRLEVAVDFIAEATKILDGAGKPRNLKRRLKQEGVRHEGVYDDLAQMIFEVIFAASAVTSPVWECWSIQHNVVWSHLYQFGKLDGPAGRVIAFKARRLLYDEILRMNRFPNFKGARVLRFCLNVMGFNSSNTSLERANRPLRKAVLGWTKTHYAMLQVDHPRVAAACLVDGMSYEEENHRLVKTYAADGLRRVPHYVYFVVDPKRPIPGPAV